MHTMKSSSKLLALSLAVLLIALGVAEILPAQAPSKVTGQARAAQVGSTMLADTGTLSDAVDARESSQIVATTSGMNGESLHATAVGNTTTTRSEASMADVAFSSGGSTVAVAFALAEAAAACSAGGAGTSGFVSIDGLTVNGQPVEVTGAPNQTVTFSGGKLIINEQVQKTTGGGNVATLTVNALHVVSSGTDTVVASADAGVDCR